MTDLRTQEARRAGKEDPDYAWSLWRSGQLHLLYQTFHPRQVIEMLGAGVPDVHQHLEDGFWAADSCRVCVGSGGEGGGIPPHVLRCRSCQGTGVGWNIQNVELLAFAREDPADLSLVDCLSGISMRRAARGPRLAFPMWVADLSNNYGSHYLNAAGFGVVKEWFHHRHWNRHTLHLAAPTMRGLQHYWSWLLDPEHEQPPALFEGGTELSPYDNLILSLSSPFSIVDRVLQADIPGLAQGDVYLAARAGVRMLAGHHLLGPPV